MTAKQFNEQMDMELAMRTPPRFRTMYTAEPDLGEVQLEPSETVPNQAMSLETILARFASGRPIPTSKKLVYGQDLIDLSRFNKLERIDMIRQNGENIEAMKAEVSKRLAEKDKKVKDAEKAVKDAAEAAKIQTKAPDAAEGK